MFPPHVADWWTADPLPVGAWGYRVHSRDWWRAVTAELLRNGRKLGA